MNQQHSRDALRIGFGGESLISHRFMQGPVWLLWVLATLTSLWTINFGAVLTWQTSLYYFHRQENILEDLQEDQPAN